MPNENDRNDVDRGDEQDPNAQQGTPGSWNRDEDRAMGRGEEGAATSMPSRGESGDDEPNTASHGQDVTPGSMTGSSGTQQPRQKQRRGFAAMDPAKQREIASKGGKASHALGTGHEWNSEAAREAGRKGGQASRGGRGKLPPNSGGGGTPGGNPTGGTI